MYNHLTLDAVDLPNTDKIEIPVVALEKIVPLIMQLLAQLWALFSLLLIPTCVF